MAPRLNKIIACWVLVLSVAAGFSQEETEHLNEKEYKDKEQFDHFAQRRRTVASWQIAQLKEGALVVRLKTNHMLIEALLKQGRAKEAEEKRIQTMAANRNTMRAYMDHYNFSKVYFIYSHSSDSLLKGARANIFLDTMLRVNPSIVMTEKFYLIAERDDAYNSSIGFVPEDSATLVREHGNAVREMAVVVKNKYGHQLKRPFPYYEADKPGARSDEGSTVFLYRGAHVIPFRIDKDGRVMSLRSEKNPVASEDIPFNYRDEILVTNIPKYLTYRRLSLSIQSFNANLYGFARGGMYINPNTIDPALKPFLY
jgi:hypothetical protein